MKKLYVRWRGRQVVLSLSFEEVTQLINVAYALLEIIDSIDNDLEVVPDTD